MLFSVLDVVGPVSPVPEDAGTAGFTLRLRNDDVASSAFQVQLHTEDGSAVAGQDYEGFSGTIIFPAGANSVPLNILIFDDDRIEDDENFRIVIDAIDDSTITKGNFGVATIKDNDGRMTAEISAPATVPEDAATASVTVVIHVPEGKQAGSASYQLKINTQTSTASVPDDGGFENIFDPEGPPVASTFGVISEGATGDIVQQFILEIVDDDIVEGDETFNIEALFFSTVIDISDPNITVTITDNDNGDSGGENTPPTADAGGPYEVPIGGTVQLDGSGSFDPDGTIFDFEWDLDGDGIFGETGPNAANGDEVGPNPTFHAGGLLAGQEQTVRLRVTDNDGATDEDETVIIVTQGNAPPVADAGGPYEVPIGGTVQLDGSGSFDPDGTIFDFEWDLDGDGIFGETGPNAANGDEVGPNPTFHAGDLLAGQQQEVTLRVTDNDGAMDEDTTIITATDSQPVIEFDFGDAPQPFPTLLADDGARHGAVGPTLGLLRDAEADGQPSPAAVGDDNNPVGDPNDEDGLVSALISAHCGGLLIVDVNGITDTAFLNIWVDFNRDDDWLDPGEHIAVDFPVTQDGEQRIAFASPTAAVPGPTFLRIRLSTAAGLQPSGLAPDGEVEDHLVQIVDLLPVTFVDDDFTGLAFGDDPDGPGPAMAFGVDAFATIQDGIDCVQPGGTVHVAEGNYIENVVIPKTLTLDGEGTNTVVRPEGGDGIAVRADNVLIRDLRVTGAQNGIRAQDVQGPKLIAVESVRNKHHGFLGHRLTDDLIFEGGSYSNNGRSGINLVDVDLIDLIQQVNVSANGQFGVFAHDLGSFSDTDGTISNNRRDGIRLIRTAFDVFLTNTTVHDNRGDGLFAGSDPGGGPVAIRGNLTITGADFGTSQGGLFSQNAGIDVRGVAGHAQFDQVNATNHRDSGVFLTNFATATFNGGDYSHNTHGGLKLSKSSGQVILNNVEAQANGFNANAIVEGVDSLLIDGGTFSGATRSRGIDISKVRGAVELKEVTADGNRRANLFVRDADSVTITDGSFSRSKDAEGIVLLNILGQVSMMGVTADANDQSNMGLVADRRNPAREIHIMGGSFSGATRGFGIAVSVRGGTIEIVDVTADGNSAANLFLESSDRLGRPAEVENVAVTGGSFNSSISIGIHISRMAAQLTNVTASDNGNRNLLVEDSTTVTLTGGNYDNAKRGSGIDLKNSIEARIEGVTAVGNHKNNLLVSGRSVSGRGKPNVIVQGGIFSGSIVGSGIVLEKLSSAKIEDVNASGNARDGLTLNTVDTAVVLRGIFVNNGLFGIRAVKVGSFQHDGVTATGNGAGDIFP